MRGPMLSACDVVARHIGALFVSLVNRAPWPQRGLLVFAAALVSIAATDAGAHDPTLHGFALVPFQRAVAAPPFALESLAGGVVKLEQFRSRYVVLNFWATWCPPCVAEMPSMQELRQRYGDGRLEVVAISLDTGPPDKVAEFVSRLGLTFPVLLDPHGVTSRRYGVKDLPSTFILNPEGQVIAAAKGERDWYSDKAVSYVDELLGRSTATDDSVSEPGHEPQ